MSSDDNVSALEYSFFIEVKKTERPWIVFGQKNSDIIGWWDNPMVCVKVANSDRWANLAMFRSSIRSQTQWLGHSVHEAFKDPNQPSRWYASAVTVCKACVNHGNQNYFEAIREFDEPHLAITQPLVVLDGPLIAAEIDENGEAVLSDIPYASLDFEFGTSKYKRRTYSVDLVSLSALDAYLALASEQRRALFKQFELRARERGI